MCTFGTPKSNGMGSVFYIQEIGLLESSNWATFVYFVYSTASVKQARQGLLSTLT